MSDFRLRKFRPGDEEEINHSFNEVFHLERPMEEWRWKFSCPEGEAPILLGFLDGCLATQYAGIPVTFAWEGRRVSAAQIVDVFSTRAARRFARRGYWVQTVEAFFEHYGSSGLYPLLYGFPGRRALRLGVLQLGYDALEPQPIFELCRSAVSRRRSPRRFFYRAKLLDAADRLELDRLWERVESDYPIAVMRGAQRLLHRYLVRPGGVYHVFGIRSRLSAELVAWVVFQTDEGECRWIDFLWDHRHPGALELVSHLSSRLSAQAGVGGERLWLNGDPGAVSRLHEMGFVSGAGHLPLAFVARSFDPGLELRRMADRVYLTMGDTDLF